jgi:hypothetical protein
MKHTNDLVIGIFPRKGGDIHSSDKPVQASPVSRWTPLQQGLTKEVSRRQFFVMAGTGIVSLLGFSSFIRLTNSASRSPQSHDSDGSGAYGGSSAL